MAYDEHPGTTKTSELHVEQKQNVGSEEGSRHFFVTSHQQQISKSPITVRRDRSLGDDDRRRCRRLMVNGDRDIDKRY